MLEQPFFVPAAIFVAISIPLVLGIVPPNRFYGFRTPRAMASRDMWFVVNRYAGVAILIAAGVYLAIARALPYDRASPDDFRVWLIHLMGFAGPLAAAFVATARRARRR
jgi:branched-subunit amino acid transport protein